MRTFNYYNGSMPTLDTIPTDPSFQDYREDGFAVDPFPVPWASYKRLKSILHFLLGSRAMEVLLRPQGQINPHAFQLACSILQHHVTRYDQQDDVQSTLIANLISLHANTAFPAAVSATSVSPMTAAEAERLLAACMLPPDYTAYLRRELLENGVLLSPWWLQLKYPVTA